MNKLKIQVILGSTRQGRFSEKPAHWIVQEAKKYENLEVELLDLRDFPLPFFDEPSSPQASKEKFNNETAVKWSQKIKEADGYIIITPEYNHGYPAVLKNALDYAYFGWNRKPVAFVSYGGAGGARAIEQLRQVIVELQMVSVYKSINIPGAVYMAALNHKEGEPSPFESLSEQASIMFSELIWWAQTLKNGRDENQT